MGHSSTPTSLSEKFVVQRRWWILPMLIWSGLVTWSLVSNIQTIKFHNTEIARDSSRNIFRMVTLTRLWNARHGGVYVPVTEKTQPNPYLETPRRDIETKKDKKLTLINPAFMTRQMAELIQTGSEVSFHITSLNPIRPKNQPDPWETKALNRFEYGEEEVYERITTEQSDVFRYMAPLVVKKSCLKCHEKQGYQVGDIRGGISVTHAAKSIFGKQEASITLQIVSHTVIFFAIQIIQLIFLTRIRNNWLELEHVKQRQERVIQERTKELEALATHDDLTNLYNRNALYEYLEHELIRTIRYQHQLSIFMLDLDHFKRVNDEHGHQVGDLVLSTIAKVVNQSVRNTDYVARYGGEEFIIVLPESSAYKAKYLADRLLLDISQCEINLDRGEIVKVTTSIGIATYPDHADSLEALIKHADSALYQAKHQGRNRAVIYTSKSLTD